MLFATDLDNTMIFSRRRVGNLASTLYCVEYYQGRQITFMTYSAIEKLQALCKHIYVIPVTTRSIAQLHRIEFWSATEYAIADNGGTILHYGTPLLEWEQHIQKLLAHYDLQNVQQLFTSLPLLQSEPVIVDGKFIFAKSSNVEKCKQILSKKLDVKIWQISFQGNKIYAIPQGITKELALRYLCENILPSHLPVISAGDSNLDISMLDYANYGIIPSDCSICTLKHPNWIEKGYSIESADKILDYVTFLLQKKMLW